MATTAPKPPCATREEAAACEAVEDEAEAEELFVAEALDVVVDAPLVAVVDTADAVVVAAVVLVPDEARVNETDLGVAVAPVAERLAVGEGGKEINHRAEAKTTTK